MIEILSYKDTNAAQLHLKLCKKEMRGTSYFIPLKMLKMKQYQPILIKTPKLYMPFQPKFQTKDSGYIRLSFDNLKIDPDVKAFHSFLKAIEKMLHHSLPLDLQKKEFRSAIKESKPYADYFNVNFETNQLKVYNLNLEPIPIKNVQGKFYAYFVIQLSGLYYNSKQDVSGVVWDLIQFKLDNPKNAIQECLFLDELSSQESSKIPQNLLKDHPKMIPYQKMLNLGVPSFAVQQKMTFGGVDPEFLDYFEKDLSELPEKLKKKLDPNQDKLTPTNPFSSINNSINSSVKGLGIVNLINPGLLKGGLNKLKKIEPEDPTLVRIKKRSGYIFPVPSLDQIKGALGNLKPVEQSDKKGDY